MENTQIQYQTCYKISHLILEHDIDDAEVEHEKIFEDTNDNFIIGVMDRQNNWRSHILYQED